MTNYMLAFRGPAERTTSADDAEAWGAWFQSLGTNVIDFGHQVRNVRTLNGNAGPDPKSLVLTGYVVISADNEESAVRLASGCPGLASGFKVEVGEAVDV
jgi:hypothetical protein